MAIGLAFDSESGSLAGRLEEICEGFESAWRRNERHSIEDTLLTAGELRDKALVELVHIELELRLQAGEAARAEEYFARFPGLTANKAVSLALIKAEFRHRLSREPILAPSEFVERFPWLTPDLELRTNMTAARDGSRAAGPKCPYCREVLQPNSDLLGDGLFCSCCGSSFHLERDDANGPAKRPLRIGKFELLSVLGQGGCGTVYRARDTELDRIVAVKLPRSGSIVTQEEEDRFLREGRSVAQLRHPGIVQVYEVGRVGVFPYMASEFVEGRTLDNAIFSRRFGFRNAAEIVAQAAEALQHAHSRGIVHRDIKPSNIMIVTNRQAPADSKLGRSFLSPPTPKFTIRVMDFGLARRDEGEATITVSGQVLGTPAYMSPEQARGDAHRVSGRSDIYSLGVILYQLLTNERPFGGNARMLVHQVLNEDPRPPRQLNDRVPKDLETITLKCLQKSSADRYSTAEELALDLRRFLADEPIRTKPIGRITRAIRLVRRRPASVIVGLVMGLLLALTVGFGIAFFQEAQVAAAERLERDRLLNESLIDFSTVAKSTSDGRQPCLDVPDTRLTMGDLNNAYAHLTAAIRIGREQADKTDAHLLAILYNKRGLISAARRNWSDAVANFNKALKLDPNYAEAYLNSRSIGACLELATRSKNSQLLQNCEHVLSEIVSDRTISYARDMAIAYEILSE